MSVDEVCSPQEGRDRECGEEGAGTEFELQKTGQLFDGICNEIRTCRFK